MIAVKRIYEKAEEADGLRFFVERLWPRGIKKEELIMDEWIKELSPSPELRKWYHHDLAKWEVFQRRYRDELDEKPEIWGRLIQAAKKEKITLLYAARDTEHNSALVLQSYLLEHMKDTP